jgi:hypothetical protein
MKDRVAPRVAPLFLIDMAAGTTPHEQRGRGSPAREAFITERIFPADVPRYSTIFWSGTRTLRMPATANPKSR